MTPPLPGNPGPEDQGWSSPFEGLLPPAAAGHDSQVHPADPVFGTPGHDAGAFPGQQSYPDTCAIRCQEFVLEQFTGLRLDEGALVREAQDHGWYHPGGGTSPADVGNLLELHGVDVHRYSHASVFHLANELAQGHKVIVGVASDELWHQHPVLQDIHASLHISPADHAVVVSGIDTTDPDHVRVVVSDPGTGQPAASYPLEQFVDAWRGSDFFMVATDQPAPPTLPEMAHFDYGAGHIPTVAGVPYEEFADWHHHPDDWQAVVHDYVETHEHHAAEHGHHDPGADDAGHAHHHAHEDVGDYSHDLGHGHDFGHGHDADPRHNFDHGHHDPGGDFEHHHSGDDQ
jgi:hypothetical protein